MKFNNLEVIQSYILTTAKYDFTVYEKRILYRLVQIAQADLKGQKLDKNYIIGENLFRDKRIFMKYTDLLPEDDKNHSRIKKALWSLIDKKIEYENLSTGRQTKFTLIQGPSVNRRTSEFDFTVNAILWDVILAISSKGWRKFEIEMAMSFDSTYAMRFYELFSGQDEGSFQQFTVEGLKEMFNIENKYKLTADFIRRVIESAKKELDAKSPYSFTYKLIKKKGSKKVTSILFYVVHLRQNQNEESEANTLKLKTSSSHILDRELRRYLMDKYGFDEKGLRSNIELIESSLKAFDLRKFLSLQLRTAETNAKNKTAWIIGAMRKHLQAIEDKKTSKKSDDLINDLSDSFTSD